MNVERRLTRVRADVVDAGVAREHTEVVGRERRNVQIVAVEDVDRDIGHKLDVVLVDVLAQAHHEVLAQVQYPNQHGLVELDELLQGLEENPVAQQAHFLLVGIGLQRDKKS